MISALIVLAGVADPSTYLLPITAEMDKQWPGNRTVTIVCHGHSVPAGYFVTPVVNTFGAYPHLLHVALKERYPFSVINVIVTAIGGENSEAGAKRFERDVLSLHPDLVTIDYALNDRGLSLEAARTNWQDMIDLAKQSGAKVILLTPTPDVGTNILDASNTLNLHADQVRALAVENGVGLVDSYAIFQAKAKAGEDLQLFMAQGNHPNELGHQLVATSLLEWFPKKS